MEKPWGKKSVKMILGKTTELSTLSVYFVLSFKTDTKAKKEEIGEWS